LDRCRRQLFEYYLGFIANPSVKKHVQTIPNERVAYAKQWG